MEEHDRLHILGHMTEFTHGQHWPLTGVSLWNYQSPHMGQVPGDNSQNIPRGVSRSQVRPCGWQESHSQGGGARGPNGAYTC